MVRKKTVYLSLSLLFFTLSGSADMQDRIAAAQGREKLDLILQFFRDPGLSSAEKNELSLLERYAREALALARRFHDRRAEALSEKHLAHLEFQGMRYDPALEGCYRSRRAFRELGDRNGVADVEKEIGAIFSSVFHVFSDYGRAREFYAANLALARQHRDLPGIARALIDLANVCHARGDFQKAIPLFQEALQAGERLDVFPNADDILTRLGDCYLKTGDAAASMKYIQRSLEFSKKKRQAQIDGLMYSQKGAVYMEQGDFSRARSSFEQALEIRVSLADPMQISREMRKLGRLYSRSGQNAKAQEYARRSLALRQKISDQNEILQTVLARAATLLRQKDLQKAEALLVFCENQARQKHLLEKLREARRQLGSLYSLRLDPAKALYYKTLGKKSHERLPGANVMAGIHNLVAKNESAREITKIREQKQRQTVAVALVISLLLGLAGWLVWKWRHIRRWARGHLLSSDQRLQKKKAQLYDMRQRLNHLQELSSRSRTAAVAVNENRDREFLRQVLRHMKQDKPFLDSELTLKKMAAQVCANSSSLSKVINESLGMGFSDFVNLYRIEEAKKIMAEDKLNKWDLVDICYEVGFNSMSSFYRVFKMHTGATPTEFRQACLAPGVSSPQAPQTMPSRAVPTAHEGGD